MDLASLQVHLERVKENNQNYLRSEDIILLTKTYLEELRQLKQSALLSLPLIDAQVDMYAQNNKNTLINIMNSVLQTIPVTSNYRVILNVRPVNTGHVLDFALYSAGDQEMKEIDLSLGPGKFAQQLCGLILQATSAIMMGHTEMFWDEPLSNAKDNSLDNMQAIVMSYIEKHMSLYIVDQKKAMYAGLPREEVYMESYLPAGSVHPAMDIVSVKEEVDENVN